MNENQRPVTLPTIPKEVAATIECLREERGRNNEFIAELHLRTGGGLPDAARTLHTIPFDTLLSALVNGYVVERSAEELEREAHDKIRLYYDLERDTEWAIGYCSGIKFTLDTLGIKIEGVNA